MSKKRGNESMSVQHAMSGDQASQRQTGSSNALDSMQKLLPYGFHKLIQKLIRVVLLGRPLRMNRFIADYIDVELTKRSLGEIEIGCYLKKSLRPDLYPSESCRLLMKAGSTLDEFSAGPIEEHDLELPALDRYRELDQPGVEFDFGPCDKDKDGELCAPDPMAEGQPEVGKIPETVLGAPALAPMEELKSNVDGFTQGSTSEHEICAPALDRYREFEPPEIPCAGTELKCPDGVVKSDCILDFECCDDDDVNEPDVSDYDDELCDDIDISVPNSFVMRVSDQPPHAPSCRCSVCQFFKTATYFFYHPEADGSNESEFDDASCHPLEQRDSFQERPLGSPAWKPKARGQSGVDEFTTGEIPEALLDAPALDRYREMSAIALSIDGGTTIAGQFTQGRVPDYEIRSPALDRYRAQSRLIDLVDDKIKQAPDVVVAKRATDEPRPMTIPVGTDTFMHGPISDNELNLPALDRYREMSLESGGQHEAGCKCAFCSPSAQSADSDPNKRDSKASADTKAPYDDANQFMHGPVPEYEPFGPALDRYREASKDGSGSFMKMNARTSQVAGAGAGMNARTSQVAGSATAARSTVTRVSTVIAVGADAFTQGPISEHELESPALDRYREASSDGAGSFMKMNARTSQVAGAARSTVTRVSAVIAVGADAFTQGTISEHELESPALDRYRDLSLENGTALDRDAVIVGTRASMMAGSRTSSGAVRTTASIAAAGPDAFTQGPVPEYELDGPALDRYRDLSLDSGAAHEPCCQCSVCCPLADRGH